MSLIEIEYGSIASSQDMNHNFNYLESEIENLGQTITEKTASYASEVGSLNNSVQSILDYRSSFITAGMILPFTGITIPTGYLLCDGSEVEVADFEDLYTAIGTMYGSSDSTTFCIPDLRDKTVWGAYTKSLGETISSQLPNIKGQFRLAGTEGSSSVSGAFKAGAGGGSYGHGHEKSATNPLMTFDASRSSSVYSSSCTIVQPPAIAINFIIKY